MASEAAAPRAGLLGPLSPTHLGLVGQVATSWGVAGGLVAAMVVTIHMMLGQLSSSLGFLTTSLFFLVGSLVGYLHGGILAYVGRPGDVERRLALHRLALASLYAVPAIVAGWIVSMILAMSAASLLAGRVIALMVSLIGWLAAAGLITWAVVETRGAVANLCRRWPDARGLLLALGLAFLALLPVFVVTRPAIWVVGVKPTATAAAIMALAASVWIVGPFGVLALLAVRAWSGHRTPSTQPEVPHGAE